MRHTFAGLAQRIPFLLALGASIGTLPVSACAADDASNQRAREILEETGIQGGFVVHVGCGDGQLTTALRMNDRFQVHGIDTDRAGIEAARKTIEAAGQYGPVAVDQFDGKHLPYIDNLVNLLIAEDAGDVSADEINRVLAPNGVAYVRTGDAWTKTVKPRPPDIDEWTHYLHDASGNAVAHDTVVGPPRHLQWLGSPRWSRHHDRMASMSAMVSAGGRVFYIMDEGSRISIQMPPKWTLVARDAFNGTILWKRPIPDWHSHLWPLKSGPTQLARRLVAEGDRVYVTLGLHEPLTALNAATGEVVHVYEDTKTPEEVVFSDGILFLLVNRSEWQLTDFAPKFNTGDQTRVREDKEFHWNETPREVVAIDAGSGKILWKRGTKIAPLTLSSDDQRIYYHDGEKVVSLERYTGNVAWSSAPMTRRSAMTMNFGPRLVVQNGVVVFAGGDQKMTAVASDSGKPLWTSPHGRSGYQSPEDVLVINGLVWNAPTTSGNDTGVFTARDIKTGEAKIEFAPDVDTYWFHHRCYIAKATDNFLMPSRTGIEFVDPSSQHWDINHWVRGGCLYGVMPCNGLLYAPPHNCACYPEAKLYGMNALAPLAPTRPLPKLVSDEGRLERGPAFADKAVADASTTEWPTYRHDPARSGFVADAIDSDLKETWTANVGGRLTPPTIAGGQLFVSKIDSHQVCALDADSGQSHWCFTTGGRVDSPPTFHKGRIYFGCTDGWVYALRASDGELAWRFRAAPEDRRLMAFEQLESVWPVHGSVLVENDTVYFVAGRSNYLDGGLRFIALDAQSGHKQAETIIDEQHPDTGKNLQDNLQVLQMAVGLPDVLSSDGKWLYMRSQRMDATGKRYEIGPNSGDFAGQASVHNGETAHLFAPMGFLDDTWFHRSYWVFGRSFAGGHAGYYQAGRFAPSGRILVFDDKDVYGYGRKPEYLKWTTTIEHQLFSASRVAPTVPASAKQMRRGGQPPMVSFGKPASLNPKGKALAVEAWVKANRPGGVILAHGGPLNGYALTINGGKPGFLVRAADKLTAAVAPKKIVGQWAHLIGVLTADKKLKLYVNGEPVASADGTGLLSSDPAQGLEIGIDDGSAVGNYKSPNAFNGVIDEVRIYHGPFSDDDAQAAFTAGSRLGDLPSGITLVLSTSFDDGNARDDSGNNNHGSMVRAIPEQGRFGVGVSFSGRGGGNSQSSNAFVEHKWTQDVPIFVRAMLKANDTLLIAGPPDVVDEEESFARLMDRDKAVQQDLTRQNDALEGRLGAVIQAVSATDGNRMAEWKLAALPVWDGMALANRKVYLSLTDGSIVCLSP